LESVFAGGEVTPAGVKTFVIKAGERRVSPGAINTFARSVNSFLTWLRREGRTAEHLKIPKVKQPKRIIPTYTPEQADRILSHKPANLTEHRVLTILAVMVDSGIRINEALTLTRDRVDLDNLIIRVSGKGQKDRVVPFSIECRKLLYRWVQSHKFDLVFPNVNGRKLRYDNLRADFLGVNLISRRL
jgi:integrase/recombinase XerD